MACGQLFQMNLLDKVVWQVSRDDDVVVLVQNFSLCVLLQIFLIVEEGCPILGKLDGNYADELCKLEFRQ